MSLLDTILGKNNKNKGLTKEQIRLLDILRNLRQVLTGCEVLFGSSNSELSLEQKREIIEHVKDYNKNIQLTQHILNKLDSNLKFDYNKFRIDENPLYLNLKDKSSSSHMYEKIKSMHKKMHELIQETKERYRKENVVSSEKLVTA